MSDTTHTRPPPPEAPTLPPSEPAISDGAPRLDTVCVPGYEILSTLGRGGMGVVYQARQTKLGRIVALKMILSGAHADAANLARFRTEAEAIARLQHPNIVQIHEIGEHGGLPFFSLEFCGGGSLEKKLSGTPLPPKEAAGLVEALARAMQAAHDKGVIHRDLKPANVLLTADSTPKITDFGLAKKLDEAGQTATGAVMGTPSYMAPEQAGGKTVGSLADVYALGAILYECLTGRPPFKAATAWDTIVQVLSQEPAAPSLLSPQVPRDLETICLKCLQKEPVKRYASAQALAEDLRRFQADEPIVARPVGRLEQAWKWARRNPALAGMTAALMLVLLIATGISTAFGIAARQQAELAKKNEAAAIAKGKALAAAMTANRIVAHTHEVLADLDELLFLVKDAEFSQRGYLLTEEESYLKPYVDARKKVLQVFEHVRELTRDSPDQQRRLKDLEPLLHDKFMELQESIDLRKRRDGKGFEDALEVVQRKPEKLIMDEARAIIQDMKDLELRTLRERELEAARLNEEAL